MTRGRRRQILLLLLAAAVGGCASLGQPASHGPEAARYLLAPARALPEAAPAGGPVLEVRRPRAAPGYGSDAMLYLRRPRRLEAYARGRWAEPPARMLQPALVAALAASGLFRAVLAGPAAARTDLRLETTLLALHHDLSGAQPRVRLVLRAVLVDPPTRRVLAARRIEAAAEAAAAGAPAMAEGAARALDAALAQVAAFCRQALAGAEDTASVPSPVTQASASSTTAGSEGRRRAASESVRRQRAAPGTP